MKKIISLVMLLCIITCINAQEKKVAFNKGVLKICTSSKINIKGYDGNEVIIKKLNYKYKINYNPNFKFDYNIGDTIRHSLPDSISRYLYNSTEKKLGEGLTPIGQKVSDQSDNLGLTIEQKSGELIIRDGTVNGGANKQYSLINGNNRYELLIPNSLKLQWNTSECEKSKINVYFVSSNSWELSNFKGEVEITSSYGSISLIDVSGPVLANTIGGNIEVVFDKIVPENLYSLISNDGHIAIRLPENSNLNIHASGNEILSNLDFEIATDKILDTAREMNLKLNGGKVKMNLDAGFGNIYLRKN